VLQKAAADKGLAFAPVAARPSAGAGQAPLDYVKLKPVRIGLWDTYGGSMPSGWTRWILEQYEFPFERVFPQGLDAGNLNARFDVLIFVDEGIPMSDGGGGGQPTAASVPAEYREHLGRVSVAKPEDILHVGDTMLAIGPESELEELRLLVGQVSREDLRAVKSNLVMRRVVVTKKAVLGKKLEELNFIESYEVNVTRVTRAEVELSATPERRIQFGDMVVLVGREEDIAKVSALLGNSVKQLNHTELIPIFVGIGLGVLFGSIPIAFPGIPAPVKLGLAGGPLLVAIVLSRIGRIGPLLWYMPNNANFALREIGIVLFLACVGLHSGEKFIDTLVHGAGLEWMGLAVFITVVPLLIVALFARLILKTNYVTICGLLAGSMTDPPALAFANSVSGSDAPSISYATVYPLTMLLRVLCAQLLILLFL